MDKIHKFSALTLGIILIIILGVFGFGIYQYFTGERTVISEENDNSIQNNTNAPSSNEPQFLERLKINKFFREHWVIIEPVQNRKLMITLNFSKNPGPYPLILLVPGGLSQGSNFDDNEIVENLVSRGYAVAYFNNDGYLGSQREENYNGYQEQDELHYVLKYLAERSDIDSQKIGIVSYSYGVTLASGTLARHLNDPAVQFLIDWEGPMNRDQITNGCGESSGKINWPKCTQEDFWWEREAFRFLEQLNLPYLRVQGEPDHVQPNNEHAILALNSIAKSAAPWYRINDAEANQVYSLDAPPEWIKQQSQQAVEGYILELAKKFFNK